MNYLAFMLIWLIYLSKKQETKNIIHIAYSLYIINEITGMKLIIFLIRKKSG